MAQELEETIIETNENGGLITEDGEHIGNMHDPDDLLIDSSEDEEFLKEGEYSWDDLTTLKNELGESIIEFIQQVKEIITNPNVINNLNDKKDHFNKIVSLFFSDIGEFSNKIKNIRLEHEGLFGPIVDMDNFDKYNRLAIEYQACFSELNNLIAPTMVELVTMVANIEVELAKPSETKEETND